MTKSSFIFASLKCARGVTCRRRKTGDYDKSLRQLKTTLMSTFNRDERVNAPWKINFPHNRETFNPIKVRDLIKALAVGKNQFTIFTRSRNFPWNFPNGEEKFPFIAMVKTFLLDFAVVTRKGKIIGINYRVQLLADRRTFV